MKARNFTILITLVLLGLLGLVLLQSCGDKQQIVVWRGSDIIGAVIIGIILCGVGLLFLCAAIADKWAKWKKNKAKPVQLSKYKVIHKATRSKATLHGNTEAYTLFDVYERVEHRYLWGAFKYTEWKIIAGYKKEDVIIENTAFYLTLEELQHYLFTVRGIKGGDAYIFFSNGHDY